MSEYANYVTRLRGRAVSQKERGHKALQLMLKCGKRPYGFPRGEFVAEFDDANAYAFDCDKLIAWCDAELRKEAPHATR